MTVTIRWAAPFLILAAVLLPLPFAIAFLVFGVLLAVRPRGEPAPAGAVLHSSSGPAFLRGPPR